MRLDLSQNVAVKSTEKNILVVAGPGSGKTKTVTERVKELIAKGVAPARIVVITFTNNAAAEMKSRFDCKECDGKGWYPEHGNLPESQPEQVQCEACRGQQIKLGFCGTIHSFMLKLAAVLGDKKQTLSIADDDQAEKIFKQALARTNWKGTQTAVREVIKLGPQNLRGRDRLTKAEIPAAAYFDIMREGGLTDYDGILHAGLDVIRKTPAESWPFDYLFVDELQDTCPLFMQIFQAMPFSNRCYVGDPDQSIYSFMGADVGLILAVEADRFWQTILLENNYRSGVAICESAQRLIERNRCRVQKVTRPMRADAPGNVVYNLNLSCPEEELALIADRLQKINWKDCAILYRYNAQVKETVEFLRQFGLGAGIDFVPSAAGEMPTDWRKAKLLVALMANPYNNVLAQEWIAIDKGPEIADAVAIAARAAQRSINAEHLNFEQLASVDQVRAGLMRQHIGWDTIEIVEKLMADLPSTEILELVLAMGHVFGSKTKKEGLTVSTIHAAKGLEWDTVFMPAFEQSIMPAKKTGDALEEERRLAYVGATRAKNTLYISTSKTRVPQFQRKPQAQEPSQFVLEMMAK